MELQQLEKLLNLCWEDSETERLLLGNGNEVFTEITGTVFYVDISGVSSFEIVPRISTPYHVVVATVPHTVTILVSRETLQRHISEAYKVLGENHGTQTT